MNLDFCKPTPSEYQECLDMIEDFYALDNYPFNRKKSLAILSTFLSEDSLGRFWVIQFENQIIGYLILTFGFSFEYGGRDAFIDEFYLKERFRRQGYGKEILNQLDEIALELDVNAIHLEVEKTNTAGKNLYALSGYKGNNRSLLTKKITK